MGEGTFAGTRGNEEDAGEGRVTWSPPEPDVRLSRIRLHLG